MAAAQFIITLGGRTRLLSHPVPAEYFVCLRWWTVDFGWHHSLLALSTFKHLAHFGPSRPIAAVFAALFLTLLIGYWVRSSQFANRVLQRALSLLPQHPLHQMLAIFIISVAGRVAFLHAKPIPLPSVHDEFSYLLAADTFAHGRLTNPTPEFWTHFETYHELMHPTYMSKYPPSQGLFLALGQVLFEQPFAGVIISCALMCVALYWALAGIMPRRWAFLGGILAAIRLSWYTSWATTYWGGAATALAACLCLGSAVRLSRKLTGVQAAIFAFSLIMLANSRPYEGLLLALPVSIALAIKVARMPRERFSLTPFLSFFCVLAVGIGLMVYDNWRVTGDPLELPYSEHNRQYSMPPSFIFQPVPVSTRATVSDQKNQYDAFGLPDYFKGRTLDGFLGLTWKRISQILVFYVGTYFVVAMIGAVLCWRNTRFRLLLLLLALMMVGWELVTWAQIHYYAPATPVFFALEIFCLRALYTWRRRQRVGKSLATATVLVAGIFAFLSWFAVSHRTTPQYLAFGESKASVTSVLEQIPGNHLVLVRYPTEHNFLFEWVYNSYNIPSQRIIWAHNLDPVDPNLPLICHYRDRHVWMLEPSDTEAWQTDDARRALTPVDTGRLCSAAQIAAR